MSSRTIALIAIIIASLLWGTAGTAAKILLRVFEPFPLAFWRFAFASVIIIPFLFKQNRLEWRNIIKDIVPIALLSTANITLFYFGLQKTTANAAAIIYTATPLITVVLAKFLINEQFTSKKIVGILIGLLGVLFITLLPLLERGKVITGDVLGNFLIIIAVFTWAAYTVGSRHLIVKKGYSPITISSISIIISTIVFLFMTVFTAKQNYIAPILNLTNLLLILHLAILVTVATYLLFQWAIKHSSATTASLNNYLSPVFGVWLNLLILHENITFGFIVGSILVIAGVLIATGTQLIREFRKLLIR